MATNNPSARSSSTTTRRPNGPRPRSKKFDAPTPSSKLSIRASPRGHGHRAWRAKLAGLERAARPRKGRCRRAPPRRMWPPPRSGAPHVRAASSCYRGLGSKSSGAQGDEEAQQAAHPDRRGHSVGPVCQEGQEAARGGGVARSASSRARRSLRWPPTIPRCAPTPRLRRVLRPQAAPSQDGPARPRRPCCRSVARIARCSGVPGGQHRVGGQLAHARQGER